MKKIAITIIVALFSVFTLTACAGEPEISKTKYYELLNKSFSDVYTTLSISANDVENVSEDTIMLPGTDSHLGNDYKVTLQFDEKDTLYGYTFTREYVDKTEHAVAFFQDAVTRLNKLHGEPVSSDDIQNKLSNIENPLDSIVNGETDTLLEKWNIKDKNKVTITASLQHTPGANDDVTTKIVIDYKIPASK